MNRLLAILPLLFLTACEKPQPANPFEEEAVPSLELTDWPITRGSPSLQGRVAAATPKAPVIEWTIQLESPGSAEAAVADGSILVGDAMGVL
jgi:hypothetical protein